LLPTMPFNARSARGHVIDTERHAVRIAKVELGKIAVQVLFLTVLIDAFHARLKSSSLPQMCLSSKRWPEGTLFWVSVSALLTGRAQALLPFPLFEILLHRGLGSLGGGNKPARAA